MKKIFELIRELRENKFYGELLVKFEAGKIIVCKKTETLKIK